MINVSFSHKLTCSRITNALTDDPEAYNGAPAGVQLVGRRLEEEKILTLADYISQEMRLQSKTS